jgi:hypothetical protein
MIEKNRRERQPKISGWKGGESFSNTWLFFFPRKMMS